MSANRLLHVAAGLALLLLPAAIVAEEPAISEELRQRMAELQERMKQGDMSASLEYKELYSEMMRQMMSADPEERQRIIEANQNLWHDEEEEQRRTELDRRVKETDRADQVVQEYLERAGSASSPMERQQMQQELLREMSEVSPDMAAGVELLKGMQAASGSNVNDPAFAAWKEDYLASLTTPEAAQQARDTMRHRYQRYVALVIERREARVLGAPRRTTVSPEQLESMVERGQKTFADLGLALKLQQIERLTQNVGLLQAGNTDAPIEIAGFAEMLASHGNHPDLRNIGRDSRLRPAISELTRLSRSDSPAVRIQALNSLGIAHCVRGELEEANEVFDQAYSTVSNLNVTPDNRLALRFNAETWGCDGNVNVGGSGGNTDSGANVFAMMQQAFGGLSSRLESFHEDASRELDSSNPIVLQSGIMRSIIATQMRGENAASRQQLEELLQGAGQQGDPLVRAALMTALTYNTFELGDMTQAAAYLAEAERLSALSMSGNTLVAGELDEPELDSGTLATLRMLEGIGTPEATAMAETLRQQASLAAQVEHMDQEEFIAQQQALLDRMVAGSGMEMPDLVEIRAAAIGPNTAEEVMAAEPVDAAEAVNHYLEKIWLKHNERSPRIAVLIGDNSGLQDIYVLYDRVVGAWLLGYAPELLQAIEELSNVMDEVVQNNLYGLSFAGQLAFIDGYLPTQTSVVLSINRVIDIGDANLEFLLGWKGLLTLATRKQSTVVAQALTESAYRSDAKRLLDIRRSLSTLMIAGKSGEIAKLTNEKEQLERRLNIRFGTAIDNEERVSLRDLWRVLRGDEVFVDLYRYDRYEATELRATEYAALIVEHDQPLRIVEFGEAASIDRLVSDWNRSAIDGSFEEPDIWSQLRSRVWTPIEQELRAGDRRIVIAPDGELARVPWHLFHEDGELSQVDSARALKAARTSNGTPGSDSVLLVGDVDFGRGPLTFRPLAGTRAEIQALGAFAGNVSLTPVVLDGSAATEATVVDALSGARWVHLATHGIFYSSIQPRASSRSLDPSVVVPVEATTARNPMMNSGLAFAGINQQSAAIDGYLTAEEMLGIDLSATEMVVLSACNTGRGLDTTGQGVIGLRSALSSAGARSLLMSLWAVDDAATMEFMQHFYDGIWRQGLSKPQALKQAQNTLRSDPRYAEAYYWAAWVLVDGS